jgi:hypothetical protein
MRIRDGDPDLRTLYDRHYSCRRYADGRRPKKTIGPGEYMALATADMKAVLFRFRRNWNFPSYEITIN